MLHRVQLYKKVITTQKQMTEIPKKPALSVHLFDIRASFKTRLFFEEFWPVPAILSRHIYFKVIKAEFV